MFYLYICVVPHTDLLLPMHIIISFHGNIRLLLQNLVLSLFVLKVSNFFFEYVENTLYFLKIWGKDSMSKMKIIKPMGIAMKKKATKGIITNFGRFMKEG